MPQVIDEYGNQIDYSTGGHSTPGIYNPGVGYNPVVAELDTGTGDATHQWTTDYSTKTCKLIINYYANGATGNPPSSSTASYSGEWKSVTLKLEVKDAPTSMTYSGHVFIGWSTTSSGSVTHDPGKIVKNTWAENAYGVVTVNLYAVWSDHGRIIYKPGASSYTFGNANEYGQKYSTKYSYKPEVGQSTSLRGALYTRTGYTQNGWQSFSGSLQFDLGATFTSTTENETVLYPRWTPNKYTIVYHSNLDPDSTLSQSNIDYDSDFITYDDSHFTKEGYHILCWNERTDGLGTAWYPHTIYKYTRADAGDNNTINLYATWEGNEYYVIYNDGEEPITAITGIIDYPDLTLEVERTPNGKQYITTMVGSSTRLYLDVNNILHTDIANYILDSVPSDNYSIATYGSEFYTERRPISKENYSFNGWIADDGTVLTKKDVWMDSYSFGSDPVWTRTSSVILTPRWSTNYPYGKIFFGRRDSSQYGIVVEKPPEYSWPERNYSHNKINGSSGDLLFDPGRFENVNKKYSVAVYNKNGFFDAASNLSTFLHRYNGYSNYIRLEDTYEPDVYMMGIYEEANTVENLLGQAGRTEITFNCRPQKFYISGNRRIDITEPGITLSNPTAYPALPIIKVWGYGRIRFWGRPERKVLSVDAEPEITYLYIYDNPNVLTIDCETFEVTTANGDNANAAISLDKRLFLYPGTNTIWFNTDGSDTIKKISITPRWWRL